MTREQAIDLCVAQVIDRRTLRRRFSVPDALIDMMIKPIAARIAPDVRSLFKAQFGPLR